MTKAEQAVISFAQLRGIQFSEDDAATFLFCKRILADPAASDAKKKTAEIALGSYSTWLNTKVRPDCFACLILQGELIHA